MGTLLKITAHPDVRLELKWDVPWSCGAFFGLSRLMRCALTSYIFLNVVYSDMRINLEVAKNTEIGPFFLQTVAGTACWKRIKKKGLARIFFQFSN